MNATPINANFHSRDRQLATGFSLVELLCAMAITTLLMLSLIAMIGQAGTNYRLSTQKISNLADARSFFQFLHSDLSSRVAETKFFWQEHSAHDQSFAFIHTVDGSTNHDKGDLSCSIYYRAFTPDSPSHSSPKIFRKSLNAAQTQQLLDMGPSAVFPAYDPAADEVIVYHAAEFHITPQQRNAEGGRELWTAASKGAPEMLEITLALTDDLTAQRLATADDWLEITSMTNTKKSETIRRYTQRIALVP